MLEAIRQWAASLCFAAAAAGLCQMLAPESGLGRMLKVCVSVFFLCSVLLPLGSLELSFSDWESQLPQQQAQEISRQMQQQSQQAGFEAVQGQLEQEVDNFLRQQGITPVQIRIDMMQQEDSIQMELLLTLEEKDRDREEWLRQNLQSSGLSLQIEYREGDVEDAGGFGSISAAPAGVLALVLQQPEPGAPAGGGGPFGDGADPVFRIAGGGGTKEE